MARRKNPAELLLLNPAAAPPFVKKNLDNMLDRTGKTEDILTSLADIYAERAQTPEYADSVEQMHQTEDALRSAAQAVEDVWTEEPNYYPSQGASSMLRHNPRQPAKVQSVIIPKDRFTKRQAQSWIAQHGFIDPGVDETEHHYRFRQMDPDRQHFKYRTIPFGRSGIQAVVRVSRLPQVRSNPDGFDAAVDAIRAAPSDQKALQLAYPMALQLAHHLGVPVSTARGTKAMLETAQNVVQAVRSGEQARRATMTALEKEAEAAAMIGDWYTQAQVEREMRQMQLEQQAVRSGAVAGAGASVAAKVAAMPEVAQALEGTGLVPVALEQATQIAEVQTSQGVVDVPVTEAASPEKSVKDRREEERAEFEQMIEEAQSWGEVLGIAQGVPLAFLRSIYGYGVTPESLATECFPDGDEDEDENDVDVLKNAVIEIVNHPIKLRKYSGRGMFGAQSPFAFESESVWPDSKKGKQLIRLGFTYDTLGTGMIWYLKYPENLEQAAKRAVDDDEDEEEETSIGFFERLEGRKVSEGYKPFVVDNRFDDMDIAKLKKATNELYRLFNEFSTALKEADRGVYNQWEAGGKRVSDEIVSGYPAAVQAAVEAGLIAHEDDAEGEGLVGDLMQAFFDFEMAISNYGNEAEEWEDEGKCVEKHDNKINAREAASRVIRLEQRR